MRLNVFRGQRKNSWDGKMEDTVTPRLQLTRSEARRILVAVDFSEASRRALEFAVTLTAQSEAEILLLHVFEGVPGELKILEASYADRSFREEAREQLAEWERELGLQRGAVRAVFRDGTPVDREIVRAAVDSKTDLIVMGRHGGRSLFLSNTVRKVLGRAPCPVLIGA